MVDQHTNHLHTNHQQAMVLAMVLALVLLVLLVLVLVEVKHMMLHHHHSVHKLLYKHIQLMLGVSLSIQTHKSSVVQLPVVHRPTHKTFEFASFNHHQFHHQAHSSSKKCVHLNHLHQLHFAFVNKLLLFLNHLHLFFVNVHQFHHL
jgi:hypothetical protein